MRRRFSGHDKKIVGARQQWRCASCGQLLDETYHVDHIIPLHKGGPDTIENAQALCVADHAKKTVAEEAERMRTMRTMRAMQMRALGTSARPPVSCVACGMVLSPYFASKHRCL